MYKKSLLLFSLFGMASVCGMTRLGSRLLRQIPARHTQLLPPSLLGLILARGHFTDLPDWDDALANATDMTLQEFWRCKKEQRREALETATKLGVPTEARERLAHVLDESNHWVDSSVDLQPHHKSALRIE